MSDGKDAGAQPDPLSGDVLAGHSDGDVIRFEPRELPGKRGTKPLTVQFEIEVATGKRGEILALAQTTAIRDVLSWLASRRPGKDEGEHPGNESSTLRSQLRTGPSHSAVPTLSPVRCPMSAQSLGQGDRIDAVVFRQLGDAAARIRAMWRDSL